jgi:hypothetical protein
MVNYDWQIVQLERRVADGFVVTVHYNIVAMEDQYTASAYGTVSYEQEDDVFEPYEQLTPEIVVGWVQESVNKESIEALLAEKITEQKTPAVEPGLPWTT